MTDPLRFDRPSAPADLPERDREARVEELLLTGLDHYFSGQHELAINVWTRVLFLDRGHARARAYIERARSAIAERQREGEELLHSGAAAFQRGEADAARRLLTSAIDRGAASEDALALLDRIDRLEAAQPSRDPRSGPPSPARPPLRSTTAGADSAGRARIAWVAAGVVTGVAFAALGITYVWARGGQWLPLPGASAPAAALRAADEPLPLPAPSEVWLARARALHAKGRLHDAIRTLDGIRPGDALRAQADDLLATIQSELLAAARGAAGRESAAPVSRQ
jgi:hypothetical protein